MRIAAECTENDVDAFILSCNHRVATPLHYFISELLYTPEPNLENCKEAVLHVITFPHSDAAKINAIATHIKTVILSSSSWILDFDLDFFSTMNPFKQFLSEVNQHCNNSIQL